MNHKVAIIGSTGWVGKAMLQLFPDAYQFTTKIGDIAGVNECDFAFICVPTPLKDGKLDVSRIDQILSWCTCKYIVIRSTVNPGDCDRWATMINLPSRFKSHLSYILHQPEYLGETPNHPLLNQKANQFIIIGGEPEARKALIDLYTTTYNANLKIRQVTALESEIIKLSENRAIAFKVMQCQELYDVCEAAGVDYYTIRDAVYGDDPRFNLWFTFVYPDKRGFNNSKCLSKDVPAWAAWASAFIDPYLTKALVLRSNLYENENKAK